MPMTAITCVMQTNFSKQRTETTSYVRRTILGQVGKMSSWLKIIKRGGGEEMQKECPGMDFKKNKLSRGGRLHRTGEYKERVEKL